MGFIFRKLCGFLLMFSTGFTSLGVLLLFPLSITFFVFIYSFWFLFHLTKDEVLSISPSANIFIFRDFNAHHKDWLTYSGEINRPGELCYNFSILNDITQVGNFPTRISDCDSQNPALLDLFCCSEAIIFSAMAFSPLGNSDHVVVFVIIWEMLHDV